MGNNRISIVEMIPVVSSNLAACGYDEDKQEMYVTFRSGSTYAYSGVDRATYDGLLAASSPGQYFNRQVRDTYNGRKV